MLQVTKKVYEREYRKAQIEHSQYKITFHPEVTTFFPFFPPSFLPLLLPLLAKSHIPALPLPAQTPFGGPSLPAVALGITCDTHICKTNQLWKGQRVPAQASKGNGCNSSQFPFPCPRGGASRRLPVTELQLPLTGMWSNSGPSNGKCHRTLHAVACAGRLWEPFVLSQSSAEGQ